MDPEYVVTQELTEKSDVYSYGVLLLEIITGRRAIQDGKNLVEWYQTYLTSSSRLTELVDASIGDNYDFDQLQIVVSIVQWCTQREGKARPSIKQVLRLLYESLDPPALEGDEYEGSDGRGRVSKRKMRANDGIFPGGDARCLASSSSTSMSHCSRSFLLETSSPQSPHNLQSL
ncbi:hypothetical protein MLD38_026829 [Melastoma candidum]|nr:hypothetical protein MLD38_026829 [Melastoma candidum]